MSLRRIDARGRKYTWGFADQACVSGTNLGLSLLAGRALGPNGLGLVFIGFSAYTLALSLQRSLISTPLVTGSSTLPARARGEATSSGLTMVLLVAAGSTLLFVVAGITLGEPIGKGTLLFAPWLLPALVSDYWRLVLFRDDRAGAATAIDAVRLVVMALLLPVALAADDEWAIVACWGSGALAGAILGGSLVRISPSRFRVGLTWWWLQAASFGRWLVVQDGIFYVASYVIIIMLIQLIGTASVGGFRAAETLFAPFSLIAPAITLPGLPAMARSLTSGSIHAARRLMWALSVGSAVLAGIYALTMIVFGEMLLRLFYGDSFAEFRRLAWPLGTWQVISCAALGFTILLKAQQRGRELALTGGLGALATTIFVVLFAWTHGVVGAAWGLGAGSAVVTILSAYFALASRVRLRDSGNLPAAEAELPSPTASAMP